jgi:hypothetical protein
MEENGRDSDRIAGELAMIYIREGVLSCAATNSVLCSDTAQICQKSTAELELNILRHEQTEGRLCNHILLCYILAIFYHNLSQALRILHPD